jgi:hypothetical protein
MARDPSTCPHKRNIATQHKRHYGINSITKTNNTINLHVNKCRINTTLLLINHILTHKILRAIPNPPFLCARQAPKAPFPQTHDHLQHHPISHPNLSNQIRNPYQTQPNTLDLSSAERHTSQTCTRHFGTLTLTGTLMSKL